MWEWCNQGIGTGVRTGIGLIKSKSRKRNDVGELIHKIYIKKKKIRLECFCGTFYS